MTTLLLPQALDLSAAAPLKALLLSHRDEDLELDGSHVERVGGLCLQILLAARATWTAGSKTMRFINVSEPCRDALRLAQAAAALGVEE